MGTHPIFESDFDCLTEDVPVAGGFNGRPPASRHLGRLPLHLVSARFCPSVCVLGRYTTRTKCLLCYHRNGTDLRVLWARCDALNRVYTYPMGHLQAHGQLEEPSLHFVLVPVCLLTRRLLHHGDRRLRHMLDDAGLCDDIATNWSCLLSP